MGFFDFLRPPSLLHEAIVTSIEPLTPTVFRVRLETLHPFHFTPGQFISIAIPGLHPAWRMYSLADAPGGTDLELCIKISGGPGPAAMQRLRPGAAVQFRGPFGDFAYRLDPLERPAGTFFIATGTGIAPLRSMILAHAARGELDPRARAILGYRDSREILYPGELERAGVAVTHCLSAEPGRPPQRVLDELKRCSPSELRQSAFYICGNGHMAESVSRFLEHEIGVAKSALHAEAYFSVQASAQAPGAARTSAPASMQISPRKRSA